MIKGFQLILGLSALLAVRNGFSQHSIVNGNHVLEIGGRISTYYNYRILKEGEDNLKNNRYKIRDLIIDLNGRQKNTWEYNLKADLADLATNAAGSSGFDPENPGLMSAYVMYKKLPFDIKMGYDKLPYSMFDMTSLSNTIYWQRPEMLRGSFFSMRDAGITLSESFWQKKITVYAGMYTGMGEQIIALDASDASARPEYIGRIDFAFPSPYKYRDIDVNHVPVPMGRLSIKARYTNKTQPVGYTISSDLTGDYGIKMIDGKKLAYGIDASFQYQGFSAQFEFERINLKPQNSSDLLFNNTTTSQNSGVIYAGGMVVQASYHVKKLKTAFSVRYENYNPNDLISGHTERISGAIGFYVPNSGASIRAQYYHILKEDVNSDPVKWTDQVRIGVVYNF